MAARKEPQSTASSDVRERLARIEQRLDAITDNISSIRTDAHNHMVNTAALQNEFYALKARWGMVAAIIGAIFAALVTFIGKAIEHLNFGVDWFR